VRKFHTGACRSIWLTDEAAMTLATSEALVPPNKSACKAQIRRVLERLGNFQQIRSDDLFSYEEDQIYAVKARCGLRGYGWFQEYAGQSAFVVSLFVMKKKQKAEPADLESAKRSRAKCLQGEDL
jgi:hypothetical protein